ncbi:MAG: cytochrome c maturation protein CcmE [Anaerolineae bacterium]
MAEMSWEKPASPSLPVKVKGNERIKFVIGGVLLLAAVVYLILSGTMNGARYFITVDSLLSDSSYVGQTVRISGAVDGSTIVYDGNNLIMDFTVANIPEDTTDLALTLHNAVVDPGASRLHVHIEGQVKPDLLQNEAQAIMTGELRADGTFYATELLLKCPSRYEESVPQQVEAENGA